MPKAPSIETLLKNGSAEWNKMRKAGMVGSDHTGATFAHLFSANADLSALELIGTEWEKCDLSKVSFREADLSNSYFHGGRLQDCDFRGANLEGCTFEKVKLLRCDFSGARGLEDLDLEDVDMDRVVGLNGEEPPPPPPPPAHGVTSFTREQREKVLGLNSRLGDEGGEEPAQEELPPFKPQDPAGALLYRGLKKLANPPAWVLDVPAQRPPAPGRLTPGSNLESLLREAVKARLESRPPTVDSGAVERAQKALQLGAKDSAIAAMYLKEVGVTPKFRFSAAKVLKEQLRAEVEIDDPTGAIDPRIAGALFSLRLPQEMSEPLGEARRRLAAAQLYTALLEAGFVPDNNWEEALEASDAALDSAAMAGGDRDMLAEGFNAFSGLPEEARLRRLAYLAESVHELELLTQLPEGTEPSWLNGPESRDCHDQEMPVVQAMKAAQIPELIPQLAQTELGVTPGQVPEDSDDDLFVHVRCSVCGKEKLIVQSKET